MPQHKRYLRFEDDALFLPIEPMSLQTIFDDFSEAVLHKHKPWHVLKLGQLTRRGIPATRKCTIFESRSLWTHAMILSESGNTLMAENGYIKAAKEYYKGEETDLDVWIRDYWMCYCCFPQCVVQSESETSNTGNNMNWDWFLRTKFYPFVTSLHRRFSFALDVGAYFLMPVLFTIVFTICLFACLHFFRVFCSSSIINIASPYTYEIDGFEAADPSNHTEIRPTNHSHSENVPLKA